MLNFTFYNPPPIIFGPDSIAQLAERVPAKDENGKRVTFLTNNFDLNFTVA